MKTLNAFASLQWLAHLEACSNAAITRVWGSLRQQNYPWCRPPELNRELRSDLHTTVLLMHTVAAVLFIGTYFDREAAWMAATCSISTPPSSGRSRTARNFEDDRIENLGSKPSEWEGS